MTEIVLPELDDIRFTGTVIDFIHWGNPYHGPILGDTVTLADSTTFTLPSSITHNACFDFHVPGAPGAIDGNGDPVTAPVPGGEWRNYLLLYGDCKEVYGKTVSSSPVNWLYAHPNGSRWLISITSSTSGFAFSSSDISIELTATRFGDFSGDADVQMFSITLSDRGLGGTLATEITETLPITASIGISDISSDGAKCCLMFYAEKTGTDSENQRFPYSFFEIELSYVDFTLSAATLIHGISTVSGSNRDYIWNVTYDDDIDIPAECEWYTKTTTQNAGSEGVKDAIVACWYVNDLIRSIKFKYEQIAIEEETTPLQYVDSANNICGLEFDEVSTSTAYALIMVGSAESGFVAFNMNYENVSNINKIRGAELGYDTTTTNIVSTYSIEVNSILEFTSEYIWPEVVQTDLDVIWYIPIENSQFPLNQARVTKFHPWELDSIPTTSSTFEIPKFFIKRFSPTLIGAGWTWIDKTTSERKHTISRFLTKSGAVENTYNIPVDTAIGQLSATVQPVTYDINFIADGACRAFV